MMRRSFLSHRWLIAASLWVFLGVVGMVIPVIVPVYVALGIVLLFMVILDFRALHSGKGVTLKLEIPSVMELGSSYRVVIRLETDKPLVPPLLLFPPLLSQFDLAESSVTLEIETQTAEFDLIPVRLGFIEFPAATLMLSSPFGFWTRQFEVSYDRVYRIKITPIQKQISEARLTQLLSRNNLLVQGERVLLRGAANDQFHSIRPYRYPDPVRYIDHRKTAKFQKLMTRHFDSLQGHHLIIGLDLGRGMCGTIGRSYKSDFYSAVAYSLAGYAMERSDRVSIIGFSDEVHFSVIRSTRMETLNRMYTGDETLYARERTSNFQVLEKAITRVASQRSLLVILTDVLRPAGVENIQPSLARLSHRHFVVVLSLLENKYSLHDQLTDQNLRDLNDEDLAYFLYLHRIQLERQRTEKLLSQRDVTAVIVPELYWMTAATKIYDRMRRSRFA